MLATSGIVVEPVPTLSETVPPGGKAAPTSGDWSATTFLSTLALTPRTVAVRPAAWSAARASSSVLPRSCMTATVRGVGDGGGKGVAVGGAGEGVGGTGVGEGIGVGTAVDVASGWGVLLGWAAGLGAAVGATVGADVGTAVATPSLPSV